MPGGVAGERPTGRPLCRSVVNAVIPAQAGIHAIAAYRWHGSRPAPGRRWWLLGFFEFRKYGTPLRVPMLAGCQIKSRIKLEGLFEMLAAQPSARRHAVAEGLEL